MGRGVSSCETPTRREMKSVFAIGAQIEHQGLTGTISFISDQYLTMCIKPLDGSMIGPVCVCIYHWDWDSIIVLTSHHKR